MAAYPRIDPVRNRLVCFESKDGNLLKLYEFDKDFNLALEDVGVKTLPEGLSLFADQDAAVTANWVVFAASPEGQGTAAGSQGLDRLFGKTQARDAKSDASQTCLVLFRRDGSDNGTPVVIKVLGEGSPVTSHQTINQLIMSLSKPDLSALCNHEVLAPSPPSPCVSVENSRLASDRTSKSPPVT